MNSNPLLDTVIPSVEETLRIAGGAAAKFSSVIAECLTKPVVSGWIPLEAEPATATYAAYLDLKAAIDAIQSATFAYICYEPEVAPAIEQQLFKNAPKTYFEYLQHAREAFHQSQPAICKRDGDDLVLVHPSSSKSAVNHMNGLVNLTNEMMACVARYSGE